MVRMSDSRTGSDSSSRISPSRSALTRSQTSEALVDRQRLQDVGDVGRVHLVELRPQLGEVLLVHERLDQLVPRHLLPLDQALDETMPPQALLHLVQVLLQVLKLFSLDRLGHAGRIASAHPIAKCDEHASSAFARLPAPLLAPGVRPREVVAWAMYDFANSGYTTVVITAVFNAYFVADGRGQRAVGDASRGRPRSACRMPRS